MKHCDESTLYVAKFVPFSFESWRQALHICVIKALIKKLSIYERDIKFCLKFSEFIVENQAIYRTFIREIIFQKENFD